MSQETISILTTLIAVVGTIAGTITGVLLTHLSTQRTEKEKIVREKVEEMYLLSNHIKIWVQDNLSFLCTSMQKTDITKRSSFWFIDNITQEISCPIDRLKMFSELYTYLSIDEYQITITRIKEIRDCVEKHEIDKISFMAQSEFKMYANSLTLNFVDENNPGTEEKKPSNAKKVNLETKKLNDHLKYIMNNIKHEIKTSETDRLVYAYVVYMAASFEGYHQNLHAQLKKLIKR